MKIPHCYRPVKIEWKKALYRPAAETKSRPVKIKAIPYFLWDNRKPGAMAVFIPRA